mmetsp:Transcript_21748/g.45320  ORF Transcript_21748/g.45320 Transcript_21748/m.45320 type:complete len:214 (+) Transcript_21748:1640-2281(+)
MDDSADVHATTILTIACCPDHALAFESWDVKFRRLLERERNLGKCVAEAWRREEAATEVSNRYSMASASHESSGSYVVVIFVRVWVRRDSRASNVLVAQRGDFVVKCLASSEVDQRRVPISEDFRAICIWSVCSSALDSGSYSSSIVSSLGSTTLFSGNVSSSSSSMSLLNLKRFLFIRPISISENPCDISGLLQSTNMATSTHVSITSTRAG